MKTLPKGYRIIERPEPGTHYKIRAIVAPDGREIYAQLSAFGAGEVEERIRAYLNPSPPPPLPKFEFVRNAGRPKRGAPEHIPEDPEQ